MREREREILSMERGMSITARVAKRGASSRSLSSSPPPLSLLCIALPLSASHFGEGAAATTTLQRNALLVVTLKYLKSASNDDGEQTVHPQYRVSGDAFSLLIL